MRYWLQPEIIASLGIQKKLSAKMKLNQEVLTDAREVLAGNSHGALSTKSLHLEGHPFGSVVQYCVNDDGHPLIYISTIAQHTINVESDPRCSLLVLNGPGENVQAEARVTISGSLVKLEGEHAGLARYFRYFPGSETYQEFHDFACYELRPTAVRYIGGFGKIFWIETTEFFQSNPLDMESRNYVINHMNEQHRHNLKDYLHAYLGIEVEIEPLLIGVDQSGMDIQVGPKTYRVKNTRAILSAQDAHEVLVEMAKVAKERLSAS